MRGETRGPDNSLFCHKRALSSPCGWDEPTGKDDKRSLQMHCVLSQHTMDKSEKMQCNPTPQARPKSKSYLV